MKAGTLRSLAAAMLLAALGGAAAAQQAAAPGVPQPKIYAVQPAGGKAGTTVDVRIASGTDLDGADRLIFSHPGITAAALREEATRVYPQGRSVDGKFKVTIPADVPPPVYRVPAPGHFGVPNA